MKYILCFLLRVAYNLIYWKCSNIPFIKYMTNVSALFTIPSELIKRKTWIIVVVKLGQKMEELIYERKRQFGVQRQGNDQLQVITIKDLHVIIKVNKLDVFSHIFCKLNISFLSQLVWHLLFKFIWFLTKQSVEQKQKYWM